jgi:hypothetical protein
MDFDLAAIVALAEELSHAIRDPEHLDFRRRACCFNGLTQDQTKGQISGIGGVYVLQAYGKQLLGLLHLDSPEAQALPRATRQALQQLRTLLSDSFYPFFAWPAGQSAWTNRRNELLLVLEELAAPEPQWSAPNTLDGWCRVFGVHRNTMRKRLQDGTLRARPFGRHWQIALDDIPADRRAGGRPG